MNRYTSTQTVVPGCTLYTKNLFWSVRCLQRAQQASNRHQPLPPSHENFDKRPWKFFVDFFKSNGFSFPPYYFSVCQFRMKLPLFVFLYCCRLSSVVCRHTYDYVCSKTHNSCCIMAGGGTTIRYLVLVLINDE